MTRQHPLALRRGPAVCAVCAVVHSVVRPVTGAAAAALVIAAVALGATAPAATPAATPAASPPGVASGERLAMVSTRASASAIYERRVQKWVNVRRANHGLDRLRLAACPDGTAERWSRFLAANDLFYHQSMTKVLDRCNAQYAGETLGRGSMRPRRLVRMWMESPGHRRILLSRDARRIGIGANHGTFGGWVVAANFVRF